MAVGVCVLSVMSKLSVSNPRHTSAPAGALQDVLRRWAEYPPVNKLGEALEKPERARLRVSGLAGSADALLLATLLKRIDRPILVVTLHSEEAQELFDDLQFLIDSDRIGHFPARNILPYDFRAPVGEIIGRRISTLARLHAGETGLVVTPLRALLEPTIPPDQLRKAVVRLKVGQEMDLDLFTEELLERGFRRVPVVEEVGDFARRGGLVDLFSPGAEAPVRVELYGDQIDTIRLFDVATQRSLRTVERVDFLPRREIPITPDTLEKELHRLPESDAEFIRSRYLNDPELPGLEWLALLFGLPQGRLLDYFPKETVAFVTHPDHLETETTRIHDEAATLRERWRQHMQSLPEPHDYYLTKEQITAQMEQYQIVDLAPFGSESDLCNFGCQPHPAFQARLDLAAKTIGELRRNQVDTLLITESKSQTDRLIELLGRQLRQSELPRIEVANLRGGFICPEAGTALLTDHEVFARHHRRVRRKKFKEGVAISDYAALTLGDYVVHTDYGIARYLGLKTLVVDNRPRDCLQLAYDGNDRLYVPIEEFNRVSRYAGKEAAPALTKLGGAAWEKIIARTKRAVGDMAEELVRLYALRSAHPGQSFGEDSVWMRQMEAAFPYDETPDQQKAIDDVKRDLQSSKPMDRLVCGDVGYGKTEVAIRAAFKVMDAGKQVAVLVPTTILAQQHYATFKERLSEYPFKIAGLSRFRTRSEQQQEVKDLSAGKIDLVIGTHRLLSADVQFKDLGLLVIDEEHRFGVKHKEKLRQLKASVDTLSMTATPIPRTLHMSLSGVRDMSLITTSPKDRLPIITEIVDFDPAIISTAILREIERGGQVFFVHNRIQTIGAIHEYLRRLLPQVEFCVAHGQMHERSLESIMLAFMNRQYQVLICTSIIESGLDIPNANTIIINRADRFGLAQLYQLRGRVGRSSRRAFAYLLTPPVRLLKPDAIKRLRALEAHSDLGAGFALAMRDLEIRGAGELLGARQSGFIEEVGFDLYQRMLEEAVAALKGETVLQLPQTKLELDMTLHLPEAYVNDRQHKVDVYRRLADCRTLESAEQIRHEVADRFGRLPEEAVNLFDAAGVKIAAAALEIEKVKFRDGIANIFFMAARPLKRPEIEALRKATDCPLEFSILGPARITVDLTRLPEARRLPHLRDALVTMLG